MRRNTKKTSEMCGSDRSTEMDWRPCRICRQPERGMGEMVYIWTYRVVGRGSHLLRLGSYLSKHVDPSIDPSLLALADLYLLAVAGIRMCKG